MSVWETGCSVFIMERRTGKPAREFYFQLCWSIKIGKVIRIICWVRQDLNWWSRSIKLDLSIAVSMSFSNKRMLNDWTGRRQRILWLISKDRKSRSFILINSPHQNPGKLLFRFSLGGTTKEVETVDSVDDFKSSRSIRGKTHFQILRCWMQGLRLLWTRWSRIPTSRKRSVWRSRKLRKRVGSYEEDRSPSWSTTIFEQLVLMIQY